MISWFEFFASLFYLFEQSHILLSDCSKIYTNYANMKAKRSNS